MSGRRRRALYRAFTASHGRPPSGFYIDKRGNAHESERRKIKKALLRGRAA